MADAFGWWGQSNEGGTADHEQLTSGKASPAQLAQLRFFQLNMFQFADNVGQVTPLVLDASLVDPISSAYDYPANAKEPTYQSQVLWFGPEVYGGIAIRAHLGADPIMVKLAPGGTFLTSAPVGSAIEYPLAWFNRASHVSWDTTIARSSSPFNITVLASGTATGATLTTFTDSGASWTPGAFVGDWAVMNGNVGRITANTATQVTVTVWVPSLLSPPTPGSYQIQRRSCTGASLAKTFIEGYCAAASAAVGGGTANFNMKAIHCAIGESDSWLEIDNDRAANIKNNLLSVIWYMRNKLVELGLTSLAARKVGFAISGIKESTRVYLNAAATNRAFREIAKSDPFCRYVHTDDLELGGITGTDNIHLNHVGQQRHGYRAGAAMIELLQEQAGVERGRGSHEYFGRHVTVRPLWAVGSSASRIAQWADLAAVSDDQRQYPGFYLASEGGSDRVPIYLSRSGDRLSNTPDFGGALIGYALRDAAPGTMPVANIAKVDNGPRQLHVGGRFRNKVEGHAWVAGLGSYEAFPAQQSSWYSSNQTHVLHHDVGVTRIVTTIPGAGINREWLMRGHNGRYALSATLTIDEKVGAAAELWQRHRIGWGDSTHAQTVGVGATKVPPILSRERTASKLTTSILGMELGCDENSPTEGLLVAQVDHDADSSAVEGVLWRDSILTQEVTPNWNGIEGCFRVVHQVVMPFQVGASNDTLKLKLSCYSLPTFGKQFAYDPATTVETNATWTAGTNRYHEVTSSARTTYNPDGSTFSTGSTWFTTRSGCVGWSADGSNGDPNDGLTWALYTRLQSPARGDRATSMILGNRANPTPPNYPLFAAHDQLDYCYATQVCDIAGGTYAAGYRFRSATFLLVGTMAQVKAAANQLNILGVDASWTD